MNLRILLFILLVPIFGHSQNYTIDAGGTVNTCSGNFYDSGGNAANYANSESYTMTFCSPTACDQIQFVFTSLSTEASFDQLSIYDGPTTASTLIGTYSGTTSPGTVSSTNGCLTFQFTSDAATVNTGWEATISCIPLTITSLVTNESCFGFSDGSIDITPNGGILPYSFLWSSGQTTEDITGLGAGSYTVTVTDFNSCNVVDVQSILVTSVADVTTTAVSNITGTTADGGGNVTCEGASAVTQKGICWNTAGNPTTADFITNDGTGLGSFVSNMTGLAYSTTYFVRAYAINGSGTTYGPQVSFTTTSGGPTYCSSVGSPGGARKGIDSVFLDGEGAADISTISTNCNQYEDFTYMAANVLLGSSYNLSYEIINCGGPPQASSVVYADWNQDGDFDDPGELLFTDDSSPGTFGFTFTVPATAAIGRTGLRVMSSRTVISSSLTPCYNGHDGETEDYILNILPNYCIVDGTNNTNGHISNASINTLTRTSSYDGYILAPETTTLQSEESYSLSIEQQNNLASGGWTAAWIDWNADGDFLDAGEEVASPSLDVTVGTFVRAVNVTVPAGLSPSNVGMRVVWKDGVETAPTPCDAYSNLIDWEDYNISISSACNFSEALATTQVVCNGESNGTGIVNTTITCPSAMNFSETPSFAIPDNGCGTSASATSSILVNEYSGCTVDPANISVTVNISHTYVGDVRLFLYSPFGDILDLSTGNGAADDNFTNTVFTDNAATNITAGTPPYTGAYQPEGSFVADCGVSPTIGNFSSIGGGGSINPNGTWQLVAFDNASADAGVINNWSLNFPASTGTPPAPTYLWDAATGSQTNSTATGLAAGIYEVSITDAASCTKVRSVTVTEPTAITTAVTNIDESCLGFCDGVLSVSGTGGTIAVDYSYLWDFGGTSSTEPGICPSSHTVTVTDDNGCFATDIGTVNFGYSVTADIAPVADQCFSGNNFTFDASGSSTDGGALSYSWDFGDGNFGSNPTEIHSYLAAVTYNVSVVAVESINSCNSAQTIVVGVYDEPSVSIATASDVSCNGASDGSISVTAGGGTLPYSFLWSTGSTSQEITGLSGGTYDVTCTDVNGCSGTNSQTVFEPAPIVIVHTVTDVLCNGNFDGSAIADATGGVSGFSYTWYANAALTTVIGGGPSINGINAGTIYVEVVDGNSCSISSPVTVSEPSAVLATAGVDQDICAGNTASLNGSATGGVSGYTFNWSGGVGSYVPGTPFQNVDYTHGPSEVGTSVQMNLTVTDGNGCSSADNISVTIHENPLVITASSTNVTCFGGSDGTATGTAVSGTAPYSYLWNDASSQTNTTATALFAGTYSITVADVFGCEGTATATVTEPASGLSINAGISQIVCADTAYVALNGASNSPTNLWTTSGTGGFIDANNPITAYLPSDLDTANGFVTLTLSTTGNSPCPEVSDNIIITVTPAPSINPLVDQTICATETATLVATDNGVATNYNWSTTGDGTFTSPNSLNTDYLPGPLDTIVGTINFTLETTAQGSCNPVAEAMTLTINPGIFVDAGLDQDICSGSDVTLSGNVYGGTTNTGVWTSSGTGSFSSSADLNASYTPSSGDISGGSVKLFLTSTNNGVCSSVQDSIIITIESPADSSFAYSSSTFCISGTNPSPTSIATPGGIFTGNLGLVVNSSTGVIDLASSGIGNFSVSYVPPGTCTNTANVSVTISTSFDASFSYTETPYCSGDTALVTFGAGASAGVFSSSGPGLSLNTSTGEVDINLSSPGSYTVTNSIAASGGCASTSASSPIVINALFITLTSSDVNCFGGGDGSVTASVSGGVSPYSYSWSTGNSSFEILNLSNGLYNVTVNDSNGCLITSTSSVGQPSLLESVFNYANNPTCFGYSNGETQVGATGGISPYSYFWSNGSSSNTITGLNSGIYTATTTDANGCYDWETITITDPSTISFSLTCSPTSSPSSSDGSSSVNGIAGGTSPYTFSWSNGETTQNISGITTGLYAVTATDFNGCIASTSCSVSQGVASAMTVTYVATDVTCNGDSNGTADITILGGTSSYTFIWSNGATTEDLSGLSGGTLFLTVDDGATTIIDSVVVTEPAALGLNQVCYVPTNIGSNDGVSFVKSVSGGNGGNSYLWNTGSTSSTLSAVPAGMYSVTVTDALGCSITSSCNVSDPIVGDNCSNPILVCDTSDFDLPTMTQGKSGTVPSCFGTPLIACRQDVWFEFEIIQSGTVEFTISPLLSSDWLDIALWDITSSCPGTEEACVWTTSQGTDRGLGMGQPSADYGPAYNATAGQTIALQIMNYQSSGSGFDFTWGGTAQIGINPNVVSQTGLTCFGSNDGMIDLAPVGGQTPYTYSWSGGQTTEDISTANGGLNAVTISDASGCNVSTSISISEPSAVSVTMTCINPSVAGGSDGMSSVAGAGGNGSYSYAWSDGSSGLLVTGLSAGTISVTTTDGNGCSVSDFCNLVDPSGCGITATFSVLNPDSCGAGNGIASVSGVGGAAPLNYIWENGGTNTTESGLFGGVNFVTIVDGAGCSQIDSVNIPGAGIDTVFVSSTPANCGVADGSATANVVGGTTPFVYTWVDPSMSIIGSGQTLSNVSAGTYIFIVQDAAGCSDFAGNFVYNIGAPSITGLLVTPTTCGNSSDGAVEAIASGGTGPYSYNWQLIATTVTYSGAVVNGLPQGEYIVTVTDSQVPGCQTFAPWAIGGPAAITASYGVSPETCFGNSDASISTSIVGGTPPYNYAWSTGSTATSLTNVPTGNYSLTITDDIGCQQIDSGFVDLLSNISVTVSSTAAGCSAGSGSVSAVATGGVTNYTYVWNGLGSGSTQTGVVAGNYTVTVVDGIGCADTASVQVLGGTPISFVTYEYNDTCSSGSGAIKVDSVNGGGATTYYYSLDNVNYQTNSFFNGLVSNNFSVYVTDSVGCVSSSIVFVGDTVVDLSPFVSITNDTICPDEGQGEVSASGGNQIFWITENSSSNTITVNVDTTTTFFVFDIIKGTCVYRDSAFVYVQSGKNCWDETVETPNAFSPDGDGDNDTWVIPGIEFTDNKVTIFNRWGDYIAEIENYDNVSNVWNGTNSNGEELPTGTYFYVIEIDGEIFEKDWIQIVR